jgi:hypothetical protein
VTAIARTQGGKFAPGTSANVSGRPKGWAGLAKAIRDQTSDGQALLDYALKVLGSDNEETRDRLAALAWLSDRGWGKPMQAVELSLDQGQPAASYDWSRMPLAERKEMLAKIEALRLADGATMNPDPRLSEPSLSDEEQH